MKALEILVAAVWVLALITMMVAAVAIVLVGA